MTSINFQDYSSLSLNTEQHHRADRLARNENLRAALNAVSQENKAAAVDQSLVSCGARASGQFCFDFEGQTGNGMTSIQYEGSFSAKYEMPGSFSANFSFSFSMTQNGGVQMGEGTEVSDKSIKGEDFEFDREGILKLLEELAKKVGAEEEEQEIDLGGELDGKIMDLLQKLGLLDEEGKATPLLQMLSDYAGLNRFQAGEQVRPDSGNGYGMSQQMMAQVRIQINTLGSARGSDSSGSDNNGARTSSFARNALAGYAAGNSTRLDSGVGGANSVNGSNVNGDVNIDDRDVINIHINSNEHNK